MKKLMKFKIEHQGIVKESVLGPCPGKVSIMEEADRPQELLMKVDQDIGSGPGQNLWWVKVTRRRKWMR